MPKFQPPWEGLPITRGTGRPSRGSPGGSYAKKVRGVLGKNLKMEIEDRYLLESSPDYQLLRGAVEEDGLAVALAVIKRSCSEADSVIQGIISEGSVSDEELDGISMHGELISAASLNLLDYY